ncbi:MAG: hypothetical protein QOI31_263 [Solirubrobacterales bacterium]|jgi:hypothetical protein|nr:hypothetical protein [Solirubrobacterales bacterium]
MKMVAGTRHGLAGLAALVAALTLAGPAVGHPGDTGKLDLTEDFGTPANPMEVPAAKAQRAAEPPLEPTPGIPCGPGSRPETDIQGRVPQEDFDSGRAAKGYTCNTKQLGSYEIPNTTGSIGGFKVERYVDDDGHECAYYDTTLLSPTNIFDGEAGVNVMDMSDPKNPVRTTRLITPAMLSPHESLVVSQERGVLAAVLGNPAFNVGVVDLYDISQDCRAPVFKSSLPIGVFGHESGMAPDGNTFYSASPGTSTLVAVDISNLTLPVPLWYGDYDSHGLSISNSGNRAYVAGTGSGLHILDTTEIQDRVPNPTVTELSNLTWGSMSIPQNAIPVKIDGKEYVVEIDEFGGQSEVGAGRIINIEDETAPKVVSNLRLAVHQPENFADQAGDPGANIPLQSYAGHYCNVPQRKDPGIVACSMILSGLRVFDIRDPKHPKEIAYFNAPIKDRLILESSNWAMSSPAFDAENAEIWYSDGFQGFYTVKVTNDVWPFPKCKGREATITSTKKVLRGTNKRDVIVGLRKTDKINGGRGDDLICGRGGTDLLKGGRGDDELRGGRGHDRFVGGPGRDRFVSGKVLSD